jgi:hypothetical protein
MASKVHFFIHLTQPLDHILVNVKVKGKVVLMNAMKAYVGNGGIAPFILNRGRRYRWVVNFTPRPLYPQGKSSPVPNE